jgi:MFS family permease
MLTFPVLQVVLYNRVSESRKGKHMGFYQTIYALANIVGPVLGSWIFKVGNGILLWGICGLLGTICVYLGNKIYIMTRQPLKLLT